MLPCAVLLVGLGLVMIHRLDLGLAQSAAEAGQKYSGAAAASQVVWALLGLIVFMVVLVVVRVHRALARYAYTLALVGLFFLLLPAVLPATYSEVNGARIWIHFGSFSIQPGEFSKIALTVFAAAYLVAKRDVLSLAGRRVLGVDLPRGRDFGPLVVAWLISIGVLVRNHDLGTSLMFFGLFVVLLYVATERVSWVIIGAVLFVGGCYVSYHLFANVRLRVNVWLHVFDFLQNQGYQLSQSLFGLGTGGLFGAGLGGGRPELVPVAKSDFILSSFGEELGLFGLVAILGVYVVFISRGFVTALAVRDSFGKLLVTGIAFSFGLQMFVVAGGISRLLPETGLTTPFLSYGGSSLVANFALLALMLRVSDAGRRPPSTPPSAITTDSGPIPVARAAGGGAT
jgi:cell division protein FtsW (lipid II flippase)